MAFQGLDRAVAPDAAKAKQMLDSIGGRWWNVYIGGPESGGHGWTPALVREYVKHGIDRFMLTYVGRQSRGPLTRAQGQADGREAVRIAKGFGYSGGFTLCLDVELPTFESAPAQTVEYARAWCATVRDLGVRPGVYANPGPLKEMAKGKVPAEFAWVASWVSHSAESHDPHAAKSMPKDLWRKRGQRAWQYAGAFDNRPCEVLGLNVDINVADLGCLAPPPGASSPALSALARPPQLVRRGHSGELVERFSSRLSYLRSRRTGEPYLDGPRRRFDADVEAALKAFQREHELTVDGVYGRASALALRRAVKRHKEERKVAIGNAGRKPAGAASPANAHGPARPRRQLPVLVDDVRHLDAKTDEAWKQLVAYGHRRRELLEKLRGRRDGDPGLERVAAILRRIEEKLDTLVEIEQDQVELARKPATAAAVAKKAQTTAAVAEKAQATATVAKAATAQAAIEAPANGAPHVKPPPRPRRKLADLSEPDLVRLIERLDGALDGARTTLMQRYAYIERELSELDVKPEPAPVKHKATSKPRPRPRPRPRPAPRPRPPEPGHRSEQVRNLQRSLNAFSSHSLDGVAPLMVDGAKGHATNRRVMTVKHYLGYTGKEQRSAVVTRQLIRRMRHPRSARYSNPAMLRRAIARRRKQRSAAKVAAAPRAGVAKFDGRPVAAWLKPHLDWARAHGWKGTLNSGWRDPAYSEQLCRNMCGAPSCPGRCAGRSSNHAGSAPGAGAVDVSDYVTFAGLMRECPHQPRIFNALGAADPVHFSASGR